MTTIILTIVGILLAAAAALMVIFYGGEAFTEASVSAKASTYINAGQNISSALTLANANGVNIAGLTDLSQLHNPDDYTQDYLSKIPDLPDMKFSGFGTSYADDGVTVRYMEYDFYIGGDNPNKVCLAINKKLNLKDNYQFATYAQQYSCMIEDPTGMNDPNSPDTEFIFRIRVFQKA
jgi:hypothetical protein